MFWTPSHKKTGPHAPMRGNTKMTNDTQNND